MDVVLVVLAVVVAIAAAARSTWSPCGQSMLSTITPLAERTRGHRFGVTATWFLIGATIGGVTLGAGAAVLAAAFGAVVDLSGGVALAIAAVLAAMAAASDARLFGFGLPYHCRQVNELWLNRYRAWVYGVGFGWQIGVGVATFIMTAGVYLMIALAVLSTSATTALGIGIVFGVTRGLAVFAASRITTPDALNSFHLRFDRLGPTTQWAMVAVEVVVCVVAIAAAWSLAAAVVLAVAGVLVAALGSAAARRRSARSVEIGASIQ
jgi:MFS family permease